MTEDCNDILMPVNSEERRREVYDKDVYDKDVVVRLNEAGGKLLWDILRVLYSPRFHSAVEPVLDMYMNEPFKVGDTVRFHDRIPYYEEDDVIYRIISIDNVETVDEKGKKSIKTTISLTSPRVSYMRFAIGYDEPITCISHAVPTVFKHFTNDDGWWIYNDRQSNVIALTRPQNHTIGSVEVITQDYIIIRDYNNVVTKFANTYRYKRGFVKNESLLPAITEDIIYTLLSEHEDFYFMKQFLKYMLSFFYDKPNESLFVLIHKHWFAGDTDIMKFTPRPGEEE